MTDDEIVVGDTDEGEPYSLPIQPLLTGRVFGTGKSGSGKSNSASVLVEELLDRGHPVLIVDLEGEYWGLKETYEILHVGATEECDLQVGPEHAGKLAELALEQSVPIVLDVSGYIEREEADVVVREVATELFALEQRLKRPFLLIVEEIHEYVPQQGALDETGRVLVRIAKRGRKRGLGLCGLSQRPSSVDKDFITQADLLIWHRLTWETDTRVAKDVLGSAYADEIGGLEEGEAFVQSDWSDTDIERVQFRRKRTFDAGATPGLDDVERPELKSIDKDLVDELSEITDRQQQRQDRIEKLESKIDRLEDDLDDRDRELEQARDMRDLAQQMAEGLQATGNGGAVVEEKVDELIEERNDLRDRVADREAQIDELRDRVSELEAYEEQVARLESLKLEEAEEAVHRLADALGLDVDGDDDPLREQLRQARERIESLEEENRGLRSGSDELEELTDYKEFLEHGDVRPVIEEAKDEDYPSTKYHRGVLASILEAGGPVSYEQVMENLGVSRTNEVSSASTTLEEFGVVSKEKRDDGTYVDLNIDGINEIRERAASRRRTEELMEGL